MIEAAQTQKPRFSKLAIIWVCLLFSLFVLGLALGLFDRTTGLPPTPLQDGLLTLSWLAAGLMGLLTVCVAIWQVTGLPIWRRALGAIAGGLFGLLATFGTLMPLADIGSGWIDFPRDKVRSFPTLLLISRAYQTHGKGRSWNIQTEPIWSNIDITEDDYAFMLAHRRPGDRGKDPDEISSRGYFCARVTIERAGEAMRVMHAGRQKLPEGSVIVCPPATGSSPPS